MKKSKSSKVSKKRKPVKNTKKKSAVISRKRKAPTVKPFRLSKREALKQIQAEYNYPPDIAEMFYNTKYKVRKEKIQRIVFKHLTTNELDRHFYGWREDRKPSLSKIFKNAKEITRGEDAGKFSFYVNEDSQSILNHSLARSLSHKYRIERLVYQLLRIGDGDINLIPYKNLPRWIKLLAPEYAKRRRSFTLHEARKLAPKIMKIALSNRERFDQIVTVFGQSL